LSLLIDVPNEVIGRFIFGPEVAPQAGNVCDWLGLLRLDKLLQRLGFPEIHYWLRLLIGAVQRLRDDTYQIQLL